MNEDTTTNVELTEEEKARIAAEQELGDETIVSATEAAGAESEEEDETAEGEQVSAPEADTAA